MFYLYYYFVYLTGLFSPMSCVQIGTLFLKSTGKQIEILTKLNEMAGSDADEEIELFEVCF